MIKVLGKVLDILEMAAVHSPEPLTPLEMAEKLKMNRPTCARILTDLCESGYLKKISRQAGYAIGPRALSFSRTVRYREKLINAAEKQVETCAKKLKLSVLLCELCKGNRYILLHNNFNDDLNIELSQVVWRDVFETASGIILAAWLPEKEQIELYEEYKKEKAIFFPEIKNRADALQMLKKAKEDGIFIREKYRTSQGIAAVPVFSNGEFVAALGASTTCSEFKGTFRKKMIHELKKAAEGISMSVTAINSIG